MKDLICRPVSYGKYPILIQGETSTGKTSLIKYLAAATGNKVIRINNHEHTDLLEYVGYYASDKQGNPKIRDNFRLLQPGVSGLPLLQRIGQKTRKR